MLEIHIPGFADLRIAHIVSDYNGTLALDGRLLPGVADTLAELAAVATIHVITADTFGLARAELAGLPVELTIAPTEAQADTKLALIERLGAESVAAFGNGRNDRKMLKAATLGIALLQKKGLAAETLANANLVAPGILEALDLLRKPKRLIASLRS
ncbi:MULTISPECIES: HAD family hydrolase [Methylomonas]|uniref:ATPase P n=1 Tax=Methylomonas koyamae TaxID=702114 RepID=A0A177PH46_9GAMM|nr:HAD hydrolase family protein [Methylomonas koyamae]OAI28783.1 ATPase P [Methylomonas koyamae]